MTEKKTLLSRRNTILLLAAALLVALLADLFLPTSRDLRSFDPAAMARLETGMWESYYDRKPVKIYFELAEMLRTQFHFPWFRSYLGAYDAARAAFVFKDHKDDGDLSKAEDILRSYYGLVRNTGNIPFDVERAAGLELQWWIVHRQRDTYTEEQLGEACANAAAAIYQIAPAAALEHGRLRAAAMSIRDTRARQGGVRDEDWKQIEELLFKCYSSLQHAVAQQQ